MEGTSAVATSEAATSRAGTSQAGTAMGAFRGLIISTITGLLIPRALAFPA